MSKPANVVLLIDDEPKIRRFLRAGFELNGFVVLEAENATEALKIATFSAPDLIVLDLALPDLHGADVLERIRAWSNMPIIILSVAAGEDDKVRLLQAGADDYVVKPFGMAELLARSEAALRRYFKSRDRKSGRRRRPALGRPRDAHGVAEPEPGSPDPEGIPAAACARDACRPRRHARPAAQGDLERQSARQHPVPAHSRAQAPPEDRERPEPAAPA